MLIQTQSIGAVERVETMMTIRSYLSIIAVLLVAATTLHAADDEGQAADRKAITSWEQSYKAGYVDGQGRYAGGSEILHLEGHKGKLYAANSYWIDPSNIWYGGTDPKTAWSQILRLDSPNGKWEVDLELGPNNLRAENLKSVTFGRDGAGNATGGNVFHAKKAFNTLSISISQSEDPEQASRRYVESLRRIGNGKAEMVTERVTELPDGTPAVEFLVKWVTKQNAVQTTQALTACDDGHSVTVATHTWEVGLPHKRFFYTLKFE